MKDTRPIGVFDSGVGGLTAVKEFMRTFPEENIIYFGDTGRVPYGTRSSQTIRRYAAEAINYLASFDVKAILAACGTVSSNFTDDDYAKLGNNIPYFTIVGPASKKAAEITKNKKVGVIATASSIKSGAYKRNIQAINPDIEVFGQGCSLLIPLVENGMTQLDNQITILTLEMYLEPLIQAGVDTLILGCTHFPILAQHIAKIMGNSVALVDSGAETVGALGVELELEKTDKLGRYKYYVTDTVKNFTSVARYFLEEDISSCVTFVDIETVAKDGSS